MGPTINKACKDQDEGGCYNNILGVEARGLSMLGYQNCEGGFSVDLTFLFSLVATCVSRVLPEGWMLVACAFAISDILLLPCVRSGSEGVEGSASFETLGDPPLPAALNIKKGIGVNRGRSMSRHGSGMVSETMRSFSRQHLGQWSSSFLMCTIDLQTAGRATSLRGCSG